MLISSIKLQNLLSFGPESPELTLGPLNLLIGHNGSGKSNLIEAIALLRAGPTRPEGDRGALAEVIRDSGGIRDWLWRDEQKNKRITALLEVMLPPVTSKWPSIRYALKFTEVQGRFELVDERIENEKPGINELVPYFFYAFQDGHPAINVKGVGKRSLLREQVLSDRSILAQRYDPEHYPEISCVADWLRGIRIYRDWTFGRYTPPRLPQRADGPNDFLSDTADNLGLVLNRLKRDPETKSNLIKSFNAIYSDADDFEIIIEAGTVQIFVHEGKKSIPATRLSDGTLRFLSLLAILCNPSPAQIICIEEPELGLHPDVLPTIARLLRETSTRSQLIVTTHSDLLVEQFTEEPDAIVTFERDRYGTTASRLSSEKLSDWLKNYSLGQLRRNGVLPGNRW